MEEEALTRYGGVPQV